MNTLERARKYLTKIPSAVSGSGGRTNLFKAANALAFDFDLTDAKPLPILSDYSARCRSPFTECALKQKFSSARKNRKKLMAAAFGPF